MPVLEWLLSIDEQLFLALNGDGGSVADTFMWYASKTWPWFPFYAWLLYLVFKKAGLKNFLIALFCIAVAVTLSDRISVEFFKEVFMRPRPSREPDLFPFIHLVKDEHGNNYIGGQFGFISSHSANCAAAMTFFLLLMRPIKKWILAVVVLWYVVVVYSRIYLGVHYPGDILGGLLLGILCGWIGYRIFVFAVRKFSSSSSV